MSEPPSHEDLLERLGGGDDVFASEAVKHAAVRLGRSIESTPAPLDAEKVVPGQPLVTPVDVETEWLLAVLLPVVEYGGKRAIDAIHKAFVFIARMASLDGGGRGSNIELGALCLGRLGWSLTAFALYCGRLDAISAAWQATIIGTYDLEHPIPILADSRLRHATLVSRDASVTYLDYHGWLADRELVKVRYPMFFVELDGLFAEADFLLALLTQQVAGRATSVYSQGLSESTVALFRSRMEDASTVGWLCQSLGVAEPDLKLHLMIAIGDPEKAGTLLRLPRNSSALAERGIPGWA
jgi:hypothetical protein